MSWELVKQYFEGDPEDLIEVYYHDVFRASWEKLFNWLQGRILYLETQYGKEPPQELNIKRYLSGELSYIASTQCTNGFELSLSIIDEDVLQIDIEKGEIKNSDDYNLFVAGVNEIASVINCENYIICPEFKKNEAFIINNKVNLRNL